MRFECRGDERMTTAWAEVAWPASRLGDALVALRRHCGLDGQATHVEAPPADMIAAGHDRLGRWIDSAAAWLGMEAEAVEESYGQISQCIRKAPPALLQLPGAGEPRFLALLSSTRRQVALL